MKGAEKPVATAISRKHSAGSVGTVGCRGKADDQDPGFAGTHIGDWTAPVIVISVGFPFDFRCLFAVVN